MLSFGNEAARIDEQRHEAAMAADELQAQLIPDYPGDAEITSIDDVHEAALQIDLLKSLAAYYISEVVWRQATAHDDLQGMEWVESELAEEQHSRIKLILGKIPDQPR